MPWTVADVDKHKKGLTDAQKRRWVRVANSALARCKAEGKRDCDGSAIRQANSVVSNNEELHPIVNINFNYQIRTEEYQGRRHIVVPVVMMVEGVHSGNHGPMFHSADELGRFPESWNGIPVTATHPREADGSIVSANSPRMDKKFRIGSVFNTHMDGTKLKAEAWIDSERINDISPEALGYLRQGRPLEVSIGAFTDDEFVTGEWNGEQFEAIARNHRPDHLALLPGETGACSWEDGCGIRANNRWTKSQKGGNDVKSNEKKENGLDFDELKEQNFAELLANAEAGYREVMTEIQTKLDNMDSDIKVHFLRDVYDDYFIYEVRSREGSGSKLYKRDYSINEDGSIEFGETPAEVRKQVTYVTVQKDYGFKRANVKSNSKEVNAMSEKTDKPCCEEAVDALIANEKTTYSSEDKEWLLTLKEDQLNKLVANASAKKAEKPEKDEKPPETPQKITAESAAEVLKETLKKPEDFFQLLPEGMADSMRSGLALHEERRSHMIKEILANTKDVWTEDELKAMKTDSLTKVHKTTPQPTDYSLAGDSGAPKVEGDAPEIEVPGVYAKKEDEGGK